MWCCEEAECCFIILQSDQPSSRHHSTIPHSPPSSAVTGLPELPTTFSSILTFSALRQNFTLNKSTEYTQLSFLTENEFQHNYHPIHRNRWWYHSLCICRIGKCILSKVICCMQCLMFVSNGNVWRCDGVDMSSVHLSVVAAWLNRDPHWGPRIEDMGSSITQAINIYQPLIHRPQQYCSIHYHNGMEGKIRCGGCDEYIEHCNVIFYWTLKYILVLHTAYWLGSKIGITLLICVIHSFFKANILNQILSFVWRCLQCQCGPEQRRLWGDMFL